MILAGVDLEKSSKNATESNASMNTKYATFYIVRHGQTDWNVKHLLQGQTDIPLNAEGEKQAKALAKQLKHIHFDKVFTSDLSRAKRTAELIVLEKKLAVITQELLRERRLGSFEGKHVSYVDVFNKMMEKSTYEERFRYKESPDMESDEEAVGRFITFFREVAVINPGQVMLVVTHGAMMRAFLMHLGWGDYNTFSHKRAIHNGAYVKIETDGVDFFIKETYGIDEPEEKI